MLDLFFRKYAWTANLVLLFAAAWLLARTVNTIAGIAIRPRPTAERAGPARSPPPRLVQTASLETDKLYRLIGQTPPSVAEVAAAPVSPQNCDDPAAVPARSGLRIQFVAGVLAERPGDSLATFSDASSRESRVVGVGDEFAGARLLGLQRVTLEGDETGNGWRLVSIVCSGGTKEYLELGPGAAGGGEVANLGIAPVTAPRAGAGTDSVRTVGPNRYEIDRKVIDTTLSDLNKIATQARIVPSYENGVANGFKLFSIQPGSLYASIGIENGDVIQRVNGYEINSPEKALELYQKLRDLQQVSIELKRGGQVISKSYSITP